MLERFKLWIEYLAIAVEVAAAVVIGLAAIEAIVRELPLFVRERPTPPKPEPRYTH